MSQYDTNLEGFKLILWLKAIWCRMFHDSLSMIFYKPGWASAPERKRIPYRVCLCCGQAFYYDTQRMTTGRPMKSDGCIPYDTPKVA